MPLRGFSDGGGNVVSDEKAGDCLSMPLRGFSGTGGKPGVREGVCSCSVGCEGRVFKRLLGFTISPLEPGDRRDSRKGGRDGRSDGRVVSS